MAGKAKPRSRSVKTGGGGRLVTPVGRSNKKRTPTKKRPDGKPKSANKRAVPRRRGTGSAPVAGGGDAWFPKGADNQRGRFGVGVLIATVHRWGDEGELAYARLEQFSARPASRPLTSLLEKVDPQQLAKLVGGLSHPDRVRIARAIVLGAHTHARLSEAVGLKTGPLYHHVRTLERAGLLAIVERNTYELTEIGRIGLLTATVLTTIASTPRSALRKRKLQFAVPSKTRR